MRHVVMLGIMFAAACDHATAPASDSTLVLSAADAAALSARFSTIAAASPELSWLADSISTIVQAGTEATRITVKIDGVPRSYYAVALERAFTLANSFSTFHVIAFDNVAAADTFVIVNGYAMSGDSTPPATAAGAFGSDTVFGHLITIASSVVTDWVATEGTALLVAVDNGASCGAISLPVGVTCTTGTVSPFAVMNATVTAGVDGSHSVDFIDSSGRVQTAPKVAGVVLHFSQ